MNKKYQSVILPTLVMRGQDISVLVRFQDKSLALALCQYLMLIIRGREKDKIIERTII